MPYSYKSTSFSQQISSPIPTYQLTMANHNRDGEEVDTQESSTMTHAHKNAQVQPDYQDPMAPIGELTI